MRRLGMGTLVVIVGAVALACGPRVAHTQTLSLAYAQGDHYQYKLHLTTDGTFNLSTFPEAVKSDLTATERLTVKSVDASGVANVTVSWTDIKWKALITDPGNKTSTVDTAPPVADIDLEIASDGRILTVNGIGGAATAGAGTGGGPTMISAVLPDTAVKPGDTWSKDYNPANPHGSGTIHYSTKSTYLRDETISGVSAAVVETTSHGSFDATIDISHLVPAPASPSPTPIVGGSPPLGSTMALRVKGTVDSDVTSWIDPSAHRVLKTRANSKSNMTTSYSIATDPSQPAMAISVAIIGTQTETLDAV